MRVSLERRSDYAIRALIVLARAYGEGRRKTREIARTMDVPQGYLPQVMTPLIHGGLVRATAGRSGGYELACPPSEVTLLKVIELTEGPLAEDHCLLDGGPCDWDQVCPLHPLWMRAYASLQGELERTTFEELARNDRLIESRAFAVSYANPHPRQVERRGQRDARPGPPGDVSCASRETPLSA